jgi:hypothetical protein
MYTSIPDVYYVILIAKISASIPWIRFRLENKNGFAHERNLQQFK